MPLTSSEIQQIASAAADEAIRKMLVTLGVDATDADAILKVQKDFAHLRAWRESVDTIKKRTIVSAVTIITGGILGAIWLAIKGGP